MQFQTLEQTLFNFLILGKSRFPPKKFYNINQWPKHTWIGIGQFYLRISCVALNLWDSDFPASGCRTSTEPEAERRSIRRQSPKVDVHCQNVKQNLVSWWVGCQREFLWSSFNKILHLRKRHFLERKKPFHHVVVIDRVMKDEDHHNYVTCLNGK